MILDNLGRVLLIAVLAFHVSAALADDFEIQLERSQLKSSLLEYDWDRALASIEALERMDGTDGHEHQFLKGRLYAEKWYEAGQRQDLDAAVDALRRYASEGGRDAPNYGYALHLILELEAAQPEANPAMNAMKERMGEVAARAAAEAAARGEDRKTAVGKALREFRKSDDYEALKGQARAEGRAAGLYVAPDERKRRNEERILNPPVPVQFTRFTGLDDLFQGRDFSAAFATLPRARPVPTLSPFDTEFADITGEIDRRRRIELIDRRIAEEEARIAREETRRAAEQQKRIADEKRRQELAEERARKKKNTDRMVGALLGAATGIAAADAGASASDAVRVATNMSGMVQGDQSAFQDMQAHKAEVGAETERLRQLNQQRELAMKTGGASTGSGQTTNAGSAGGCAHGPVKPLQNSGVCSVYNQSNYMSMDLIGDSTVDRLCANAVNYYNMYKSNVCDSRATARAVNVVYQNHLSEVARANDLWNNHRGSQGLGDATGRVEFQQGGAGYDPNQRVNDPDSKCVKTDPKVACNFER